MTLVTGVYYYLEEFGCTASNFKPGIFTSQVNCCHSLGFNQEFHASKAGKKSERASLSYNQKIALGSFLEHSFMVLSF